MSPEDRRKLWELLADECEPCEGTGHKVTGHTDSGYIMTDGTLCNKCESEGRVLREGVQIISDQWSSRPPHDLVTFPVEWIGGETEKENYHYYSGGK